MGLFSSKEKQQVSAPAPTSQQAPAGVVSLTKGNRVSLTKDSGGQYTLITTWGEKDYDLYALVEYTDGHVEVVSCFGTMRRQHEFSLNSSDHSVVHVSGDKTAYGSDLPQEVMTVRLNPKIRCVVPIVYSAKNSGSGSFFRYKVSTFVIPGTHQTVPTTAINGMIAINAIEANRDESVYSFVPAIIHNDASGASLEAVELYSRGGSELRPTVKNGKVTMDSGEENGTKK